MLIFWIIFNAIIILLLMFDLVWINRQGRVMSFRQALLSCAVWVSLALVFAAFIFERMGAGKALEFMTGYLIEEALSVDNLFVFILLFAYFKVPKEQERTVLFWGILGALVMRGIFISGGVALVGRLHWVLYLMGAFLVYSGIQLLFQGEEAAVDPSKNYVLRLVRRFLPVSEQYEGKKFFTLRDGKRLATPLLVVLLVIETTDVLFATDSIPAVLAISRDAFIVYTSNVFAILGLRSLFFAVAGLMKLFHYLNYGLAVVLSFIGAKMLLSFRYQVPTGMSLMVVAGVLAVSVGASILLPKAHHGDPA
ncbi:MAG TPA: TerC family protein [Candidatus Saccharimonadales bacterium]|jgi:tellurite resistance protein TerC|nr:TerC family protein [Candidatus Saccharimonadales bacterium]